MSTNNNQYPSLRMVDAFPVETQHGKMVGLRDPAGIASGMLVLSPDVFYLLQFCDGTHSQLDLRREYLRAFGSPIEENRLHEILHNLDEQLFLHSEHFIQKLRRIEQEFIDLPARAPAHAGQSYEAEPLKLTEQIANLYTHPNGPGLPQKRHPARQVKALVAPHIDIRAGGACYAHAYKALAESSGADCFVILGTGHSGLAKLYSVLEKDFDMPFGRAKCDAEFIDLLRSKYDDFTPSDLLAHKTEHTIEFQLVFLQHLLQNNRDFTFVPILCSFSYQMLIGNLFEREKSIVENFSAALRETIRDYGKRVCIIASVDLSHVGVRYGDETAPDATFMKQVSATDQAVLESTGALDPDAFFRIFEQNQDCYRVCGFSPIYTMLHSIDAEHGELLDYSSTRVDSQNSVVTFASMVFY